MDTPLISILMPTYNRAAYIGAAIQSVIAQTYDNWELIITDDASTDDTATIVGNLISMEKVAHSGLGNPNGTSRITYIRQPHNVGIARNRNTGLEKARGTYAAILDSDDIWTDPEKLRKQVDFLEKKNRELATISSAHLCGIVGTWVKKIDSTGKEIGEIKYSTDDAAIRTHMLQRNQFAHSSVMFLRKAMLDAGGYSPDYVIGDDYALMLEIGKKYSFANLPEFTTSYRIHDTNITTTKRAQHVREHLAIIKKYRTYYPGFAPAQIKSWLRILLAGL